MMMSLLFVAATLFLAHALPVQLKRVSYGHTDSAYSSNDVGVLSDAKFQRQSVVFANDIAARKIAASNSQSQNAFIQKPKPKMVRKMDLFQHVCLVSETLFSEMPLIS